MKEVRFYNTLSKSKEVFKPLKEKEVGMYACGPTVYHFAHIGNLRTFIFEDFLRRMLEYNGYVVNHVMNITDVGHLSSDGDTGEDKMLKGAKREKKTVWEVAEFYTKAFLKDIFDLNILKPVVICKATEHIKEQILMIQELEKKGFTYSSGGNIYFDSSKDSSYGEMVGLDVNAEDKNKSRVEQDPNKKNPYDFVLWFTKSKFDDQAMKWDSPYGIGYPGWHIECSAMSSKYLGEQFDIHCGGIDLAPVHLINEIAQAEGAYGKKPWVRYWMHGEFLVLGSDEKMSKSSGNFLTLQSLQDKGFLALDYRYFCLGAHYRKPLTFTFEAMNAAKVARRKLQEKVWSLVDDYENLNLEKLEVSKLSSKACEYHDKFVAFLIDDLNIPRALALIWDLLKDNDVSDKEKYLLIVNFDTVLGLKLCASKSVAEKIPQKVLDLAEKREEARKNKDWSLSDSLRDKINELGFDLADTKTGFELKKK